MCRVHSSPSLQKVQDSLAEELRPFQRWPDILVLANSSCRSCSFFLAAWAAKPFAQGDVVIQETLPWMQRSGLKDIAAKQDSSASTTIFEVSTQRPNTGRREMHLAAPLLPTSLLHYTHLLDHHALEEQLPAWEAERPPLVVLRCEVVFQPYQLPLLRLTAAEDMQPFGGELAVAVARCCGPAANSKQPDIGEKDASDPLLSAQAFMTLDC
ncbi:unnamed protein product [Effrenium voratum]|uniref:Uncharacterized protein n=1 Tax=Effrenium voratum TaxID=2562239 RepID=A0AA36IWS2_9DINO|nr:unnamed protein product [Effrenium voratum]